MMTNANIINQLYQTRYFQPILFIISLLVLFSCSKKNNQQEYNVEKIDTVNTPKITILADLPDSLQPTITYLDQAPAPTTTLFEVPPPTRVFIDSVTGLPLPMYAQGTGFFTNYTIDDGLGSDMVHSVYRDLQQQIWFATMGGGVSKFDGETFTSYTIEHGLPSNIVWCIHEDKAGNMWFGTNDGLTKYDGRKFVNYTDDKELPGDDIGQIVEDKYGNLWITALGHGLIKYDGTSFTNFTTTHGLTSDDVWSLELTKDGKIWCGTRGGGIFYFEPHPFDVPTFIEFVIDEDWSKDQILDIYEDKKLNMWFGTARNGVIKYDGKNLVNYTMSDGLVCNTTLKIIEDHKGTIWLGTCHGINRFEKGIFTKYNSSQGLTDKLVNFIIPDQAGNMWLGTYGGGVFKYGGESFLSFNSGPISRVTSILEDNQGLLWFGTNHRGLSVYDNRMITTFLPTQGLSRNSITFLMQDKNGSIWCSPYYGGGVQRLDFNWTNNLTHTGNDILKSNDYNSKGIIPSHASLTTFTTAQGLGYDAVYGIVEDKKKNIWFATYGGGISKYDGKTFTTFTTLQGLASNDVYNFMDDSDGNLWIQYLNAEGISFFNGKSIYHFTKEHGLADNSINSIAEDHDGNILLATSKGINVIRRNNIRNISGDNHVSGNSKGLIIETFTANDGLPSNIIHEILTYDEGNLILSTGAGIVFLWQGLKALTSNKIDVFNSYGGYPLRDNGLIFKDSKGVIWAPTASDKTGLIRFDPKALHQKFDPPDLHMQSIKIDNYNVNWYDLLPLKEDSTKNDNFSAATMEEVKLFGRELSPAIRDSLRIWWSGIKFDSITPWNAIPINLTLPYKHKDVTFDFHSITTNNNLVRYQYMLDGYESEWNVITETSSATYGNIREGNYNFKVKARSPEGVWSKTLEYKFKVLPPVHRSWWAYSMYGIAFLSIIYTGHRYQKQRTIDSEQRKADQQNMILNERLRISRDLHDEVGATLSGIVLYSHLAKSQAKSGSQDVENSLNIVQQTASQMVDKLNDVVWLVNPMQDNLDKLIERLEDYGTQAAASSNMAFNLVAPENLDKIILPVDARKNIFLFCKEAVNNAVKYSKGTTIELLVSQSDHLLNFTIKDNGTGFDVSKINRGNGLDNMQKRVEEINAKLTIDSREEQGTTVSLQYPIA